MGQKPKIEATFVDPKCGEVREIPRGITIFWHEADLLRSRVLLPSEEGYGFALAALTRAYRAEMGEAAYQVDVLVESGCYARFDEKAEMCQAGCPYARRCREIVAMYDLEDAIRNEGVPLGHPATRDALRNLGEVRRECSIQRETDPDDAPVGASTDAKRKQSLEDYLEAQREFRNLCE